MTDDFVAMMSEAIALPIPAEYRENVLVNFERIQAIAQQVLDFPLPEEIEVAPVFEP